MTEKNPLQGLFPLLEKRYGLQVIDSHYVLVDDRLKKYNVMLNVRLAKEMQQKFNEIYADKNSAMHVAWDVNKDDTIKFYAEIGNNILLVLDSLQQTAN